MRYLETLSVPVDEPQDYPGNARLHDEAWLDRTTAPGQHRSILTRRLPDGTLQILAGHGTRAAFRRKGDATVRVEVMECTDEEALAANLSDNPPPGIGGFDDAALRELLNKAEDFGVLDSSGWDKDLIEALGSEPVPVIGDVSEADDVDLTEPVEPVTKLGDLWLLGRHRLLCGDSSDISVWDLLMPNGEKANIVWTDPPYGVSYVGKTKDALTIDNDRLSESSLEELLISVFTEAVSRCIPGSSWYVAAPPGPLQLVFGRVLNDLGILRQQLNWIKDQFVMGHSDYHYRHEPIFYGWTPGAAHHAVKDRTQDTVWEVPRPKRSEEHPTMKPVELVTRALVNSSDRGAVVLDPFGGSGTTMIASQLTDRVSRTIEISPAYCDVIARRWQTLTGELPFNDRLGEPADLLATMSG